DLVMWRDKQKSGSILGGVTVIWLLFEGIGYHLLTFLCHLLIIFLTVSFVWSNAASFINRSRPLLLLLSLILLYSPLRCALF
uniref:Reticulon-like protein n=1 Tax=Aegilops tauschii subsp. strangulata TaxID=200361 RepID=A0A452XXG0_AEGTS